MAVMDSLRRLDERVLPLRSGSLGNEASSTVPRWKRRSKQDRHVAGVCGGLGAATGTDARLWRVAFVFLLPVSFWVYVLAWLFLPVEPSE